MVTGNRYPPHPRYLPITPYEEPASFRQIKQCFIRKDHTCGKYLGASKSCFIACPSDDAIKILTGLISEKLIKHGIEPVVAVDIRAYGQDIFCTKICGKIIEAQFCIAILDDAVTQGKPKDVSIPNPNVYHEYGLMTSLGKYVIPLQKEGQELAFNIKTHDTIRYSPGDVSLEVDKALKSAIDITVNEREAQAADFVPEYTCSSFLAMKGYQRQGYSWLLSDDIEGTIFQGYQNDKTLDYLFFAVIHNKDLLKTCLIDIQVIQRRLNRDCETLEKHILSIDESIQDCRARQNAKDQPKLTAFDFFVGRQLEPLAEVKNLEAKKDEESRKLQSIRNSKFGVLLTPDLTEFKAKCLTALDALDAMDLPIKFPVYFGDTSGIRIGDIEVNFKGPEL